MKYKSYENTATEDYASGLNTELINNNDIISARSTNRPIINLLENQESDYNVIQTLLKTVYGNTDGIIPDVLEEFIPEAFTIGSFKNETSNYFIRLPLGMAMISQHPTEELTSNKGNPFLNKGDYLYQDNIHKEQFLQDQLRSFVIENKPQINLYERQLANLIGLDLTDLTNDIKIYQESIPIAVRVELVDDEGNSIYDSSGNISYITDGSGNYLYLAEEGKGNYNIVSSNSINSYEYSTTYKNTTNKNTATLNNEVIRQTLKYSTTDSYSLESKTGGTYTNDISNAKILKDANGNIKRKVVYYMNVVRATSGDDEEKWLPNKKENTYFLFSPDEYIIPDGKYAEIVLNIIYNDVVQESFQIAISGTKTTSEIVSLIHSTVNSQSSILNSETINKTVNENIVDVCKLTFKKDLTKYKDYKVTLTATIDNSTKNIVDLLTSKDINNLNSIYSGDQRYFDNIFDLTNAFIINYPSYLTNTSNLYKNLNLETLIAVPNLSSKTTNYSIYYDLDTNEENNEKSNYDKTARFCIAIASEVKDSNFIKLYDLTIEKNATSPFNPVITKIVSYLDPLDRRLISTKKAELNSLLSTTRAELNNYIDIKDADGNRNIEITEKFDTADNEQLRITSPITRLVSDKSVIETTADETSSWIDTYNGDTESDFFEKPYEVYDTKTNTSKYYKHTDENKGILVDKNNGIKVYNNNEDAKPIEVINKNGNINLMSEGNSTRINIRNLKDTSNNIIDLLGITRIRSTNNNQLYIRKIGAIDNLDNKASMSFVIGQSTSKDDTKASGTADNLTVGSIEYLSGSYGNKDSNRLFRLNLAQKGLTNVAEVRTTSSDRFTTSTTGNIIPNGKNLFLGYPITSRSYSEHSNTLNTYNSNIKSFINDSGTSSEMLATENPWFASFINYGYFDAIALNDLNKKEFSDSRNGVLNLGNQNIFDISSIYINTTSGKLNFDNNIAVNSENTIYSKYNKNEDNTIDGGLYFTLNRILGSADENITNISGESSTNYCGLEILPTGSNFNKNVIVNRQLFVNNHENSSTSDNSSLVVKGQSVLKGELVIGKNSETINNTALEEVTRDKSDKYKDYNTEYFAEKTSGTTRTIDTNGNYTYTKKEDCLNLLVNKGRTHLYKDVTIDGNFTENAIFNKTLTINNNNYANYPYNTKTTNCPTKDSRYVSNIISDIYYTTTNNSKNTLLPRNQKAFNLVSGTATFGNKSDASDFILNGSQAIQRRLEIGSFNISDDKNPLLINTFQSEKRIFTNGVDSSGKSFIYDDRNIQESPTLLVNGASQFSGDVVFGSSINWNNKYNYDDSDSAKTTKLAYIANTKPDTTQGNGSKVIFWGNNYSAIKNYYNSDFDFHGKTWFDNSVVIGYDSNNTGRESDVYNKIGSLKVYGQDDNYTNTALEVKGLVKLISNESSIELKKEDIVLNNGSNANSLTLSNKTNSDKTVTNTVSLTSSGSLTLTAAISHYLKLNDDGNSSLSTPGNFSLTANNSANKLVFKQETNSDISANLETSGTLTLKGTKGIVLSNATTINSNLTIQKSDGSATYFEVTDSALNSNIDSTFTKNVTLKDGKFTIQKSDGSATYFEVTNSALNSNIDSTFTKNVTLKDGLSVSKLNTELLSVGLTTVDENSNTVLADYATGIANGLVVDNLKVSSGFSAKHISDPASGNVSVSSADIIIDPGKALKVDNGASILLNSTAAKISAGNSYLQINSNSTTLQSSLIVRNSATLQSSLDVSGSATLQSSLDVSGKTTVPNGNFYIGNYLVQII